MLSVDLEAIEVTAVSGVTTGAKAKDRRANSVGDRCAVTACAKGRISECLSLSREAFAPFNAAYRRGRAMPYGRCIP
jgi:hypothetical protein